MARALQRRTTRGQEGGNGKGRRTVQQRTHLARSNTRTRIATTRPCGARLSHCHGAGAEAPSLLSQQEASLPTSSLAAGRRCHHDARGSHEPTCQPRVGAGERALAAGGCGARGTRGRALLERRSSTSSSCCISTSGSDRATQPQHKQQAQDARAAEPLPPVPLRRALRTASLRCTATTCCSSRLLLASRSMSSSSSSSSSTVCWNSTRCNVRGNEA